MQNINFLKIFCVVGIFFDSQAMKKVNFGGVQKVDNPNFAYDLDEVLRPADRAFEAVSMQGAQLEKDFAPNTDLTRGLEALEADVARIRVQRLMEWVGSQEFQPQDPKELESQSQELQEQKVNFQDPQLQGLQQRVQSISLPALKCPSAKPVSEFGEALQAQLNPNEAARGMGRNSQIQNSQSRCHSNLPLSDGLDSRREVVNADLNPRANPITHASNGAFNQFKPGLESAKNSEFQLQQKLEQNSAKNAEKQDEKTEFRQKEDCQERICANAKRHFEEKLEEKNGQKNGSENGIAAKSKLKICSFVHLLEYLFCYVEKTEPPLLQLRSKIRQVLREIYDYEKYHNCALLLETEHESLISAVCQYVQNLLCGQFSTQNECNLIENLEQIRLYLGRSKERFLPKSHAITFKAARIGDYRKMVQFLGRVSSSDLFRLFNQKFTHLAGQIDDSRFLTAQFQGLSAESAKDGGESLQVKILDEDEVACDSVSKIHTFNIVVDLKNFVGKLIELIKWLVAENGVLGEEIRCENVDTNQSSQLKNLKLYIDLCDFDDIIEEIFQLENAIQNCFLRLKKIVQNSRRINENMILSSNFQRKILVSTMEITKNRVPFSSCEIEREFQSRLEKLNDFLDLIESRLPH